MPEEQAVETMSQQPQAVKEEEFPYHPAVQVHEAVDDDADQSQIDRIQGNHVEDAHNEIGTILQARLHGESDQSPVKTKGFHESTSLYHETAVSPSPKHAADQHQNNKPDHLKFQSTDRIHTRKPANIN